MHKLYVQLEVDEEEKRKHIQTWLVTRRRWEKRTYPKSLENNQWEIVG